MSVTGTTLLNFPVISTGTESGTWGNYVNNGLTSYLDNAIAGTVTLTNDGAVTLSNTAGDNSATNIVSSLTGAGTVSAQFAAIRVTGTLTTAKVLTAPSSSRQYVVTNAATGSTVTIKASGQSGVSVAVGETATVYFNGTDYVKSATTTAGSGTVTSVGWTGGIVSVATATSTPAFTIAGTSGGVPYFNSGTTWATSAALTQYGIVYGGGAGAAPVATAAGTTGQVLTATTGGAPTWATPAAGVSLSAANTWTGTQTFNGSSSTFASVLLNAAETTTVSATAATGTINYYVNSQSVLYYTSNASANWTVNVAFSSGTSLNTALATGQTVTIAFMVTQGATAYYASAFQIDTTSVTPKWQGGTAPSSGNASGIDVYTYTITKTASATYTVLASQTQFK
jgi:hypothetical protein